MEEMEALSSEQLQEPLPKGGVYLSSPPAIGLCSEAGEFIFLFNLL